MLRRTWVIKVKIWRNECKLRKKLVNLKKLKWYFELKNSRAIKIDGDVLLLNVLGNLFGF